MSDELKHELASVLRITEPGIPGANHEVFAEIQGVIFYTITEDFTIGRMDYPYPNMDMYEYTGPRLIGLDINVEMIGARQVMGTASSLFAHMTRFVGVELWKPLNTPTHEGDESKWWKLRYHRCTARVTESGGMFIYSAPVPETTMIYTGQVLPEGDYTPKMRGTNDE
jgi:hypothetical protein